MKGENLVYASVGGELLHYGVKGMKWGVRKEREIKGRDGGFGKDSEKSGTFGTVKPVSLGNIVTHNDTKKHLDSIRPGLYSAIMSPTIYEYWKKEYPSKFNQFLTDVKNGSSELDPDTIRKSYDIDKAVDYLNWIRKERVPEVHGYENLSEEELNQVMKYGDELSVLLEYFSGTYQHIDDPEETEYHQQFAKMVDMMPRRSELPKGSMIKVDGTYIDKDAIRGPYWVFTNASGEKKKYTVDQYDKLKTDIEYERSKKYGFNETAVGKRTRERNVTSSKPVAVQKGKKINVSDRERSEKITASKKNQEELVDLTNMLITALDVQNKRKEKVRKAKRNQNERR